MTGAGSGFGAGIAKRFAEEGARITEVLARAGIFLSELRPEEVDLETVFLSLTEGQGPGT